MKRYFFYLAITLLLLLLSARFELAEQNIASLIMSQSVISEAPASIWQNNLPWLESLLLSAPTETGSRATKRADLALGLLYEHQGDRERALQAWRGAKSVRVWVHLADLAWAEGESDASIKLIKRATAVEPTDLDNYFTLAWRYWPGMGQVEEAIGIYAEIATIAPADSFEKALAEGYIYRLRGEWVAALEKFEQALKIEPRRADLHRLAALAARKMDAYSQAIEHLKEAMALTPEDSWISVELGDVYRESGQYSEASFWYSEAVNIYSDNPGAHQGYFLLGEYYFEEGLFAEAIIDFQEATRLSPENKDYHYRLGQSYERIGQSHDAMAEYLKVLELEPTHVDAQQALENYLNK